MTALLPVDEDFFRDPFPFFDRLRDSGPVHVLHARDGSRFWLVVGSTEITSGLLDRRLSKDPDLIASARTRQLSERGTITPAAEYELDEVTLFLRSFTGDVTSVVRDTLSADHAARQAGAFGAIAADVLGGIDDTDVPVDLVQHYTLPYSIRVSGHLLGVTEPERFHRAVHAWLSARDDAGREAAVTELNAHFRATAVARQDHPADDVVSALVARIGVGDLDSLNRALLIFLMISSETVYSFLATATYLLLTSPAQLRSLHDDPEQITTALEELLRLTGPHNISAQRCATEDLELGGQRIARGDLVAFALGAANHDPAVHPCPHRFDLDRSPRRHLAFGAGRHHCPAAHHARAALTAGLEALLHRFPDLELAIPADKVRWQPSETLRSVQALPVRLRECAAVAPSSSGRSHSDD